MSRVVIVNCIVQNPDRFLVLGTGTEQTPGQDKFRDEGTILMHSVSVHISGEMKSTIGTTNEICIRFSY